MCDEVNEGLDTEGLATLSRIEVRMKRLVLWLFLFELHNKQMGEVVPAAQEFGKRMFPMYDRLIVDLAVRTHMARTQEQCGKIFDTFVEINLPIPGIDE